MEGLGGICKWKLQQFNPKSTEKVCAYASRKFYPPKATIDAKIYAVMNSLDSFKIYYLDKKKLMVRTDCQAIISFFNKSFQNKPSRVRWIAFIDFVTDMGIPINFQHIDGKDNLLADALPVNSTRTSVLLEEEHDARRQMASIERAASQQVLASFENLSLSASSRNTTSNAEATMKEKKLIGTNNCQMSKKHALSSGKATFNYRMS
ncbi:hypothetical protein ZIOFF_021947 [Zingiber officinale]|uniref:Reverse transcriptase RNase H-like domain-containing protein n=1 Tax=Zingiber officinale TaxID=94328 RepID=A0A8J5HCD7_ZINOF|nr:hypothetical protein ZIOFF_021947 [Zingiber officinale]